MDFYPTTTESPILFRRTTFKLSLIMYNCMLHLPVDSTAESTYEIRSLYWGRTNPNVLQETLLPPLYLSLVLLNAPTMVRTELSKCLIENRHLHSNLLLRFLIAFDISLEILPKRRKLLDRIFEDTFPSQQRDTIQTNQLIVFPKLRVVHPE